jgi:hypothetical protein
MKKLMRLVEIQKKGSVELKKGTADTEIRKYTDKGIDVQIVDPSTEQLEEETGQKYTSQESAAVGKEVAKSLIKVLRAQGDELKTIKLTGVGANRFNIHVEYGQDKGQDTFRFTLNPDTRAIHLELGNEDIELSDFIITQGNEVSITTPELEDKLSDAMVKYVSGPSDQEYDDAAAMQVPTDPSQLNKNIAEGNSEADIELIRKFIEMVETKPTEFEELYKKAEVQASTTTGAKFKHLLSLMDKANAYYYQSKVNQDRFEADREGIDEKLDPVGKEDKDINNDNKVDSTDKYLGKRRQAIAKNMKEDLDVGHQDDEPAMLKKDVYRIAKMASMLYKELDKFDNGQEVDFPHWWQAKIIKAYDYLQSAYGYLDAELKTNQIDNTVVATMALNEKKGTCCHKCGHTHVKGTAHPTPYNTGKSNCKYRD